MEELLGALAGAAAGARPVRTPALCALAEIDTDELTFIGRGWLADEVRQAARQAGRALVLALSPRPGDTEPDAGVAGEAPPAAASAADGLEVDADMHFAASVVELLAHESTEVQRDAMLAARVLAIDNHDRELLLHQPLLKQLGALLMGTAEEVRARACRLFLNLCECGC